MTREAVRLSEYSRLDWPLLVDLLDALLALDGPIQWVAENHPAVMREMPTEHFRAIRSAAHAVKDAEEAAA